MSTSRDPSTIDWNKESNIGKRSTDYEMMQILDKNGTIKRWRKMPQVPFLNLSAAELAFEKILLMMYRDIPWYCVPIEKNAKVHRKLIGNTVKLGYLLDEAKKENYLKTPATQVIEPLEEAYSVRRFFREGSLGLITTVPKLVFVYLDYMGTWSEEKLDDFILMLNSGMLANRFTYAFTISSARGNPSTMEQLFKLSRGKKMLDFGRFVGEKKIFEAKTNGLVKLIVKTAQEQNWEAKPLAFLPYRGFRSTEYKFLFDFRKAAA